MQPDSWQTGDKGPVFGCMVLLLGVTLDSGVAGWASLTALTLSQLKQTLAGVTSKIQTKDKRTYFKMAFSL